MNAEELARSLLKISPRFAKQQLKLLLKLHKAESKHESAIATALTLGEGYRERTLTLAATADTRPLSKLESKAIVYEALLDIKPLELLAAEQALLATKQERANKALMRKHQASLAEIAYAQDEALKIIASLNREPSPNGELKPLSKMARLVKKQLKAADPLGELMPFVTRNAKAQTKALNAELKSAMDKALASITSRDEFNTLSLEEQQAIKDAASAILRSPFGISVKEILQSKPSKPSTDSVDMEEK